MRFLDLCFYNKDTGDLACCTCCCTGSCPRLGCWRAPATLPRCRCSACRAAAQASERRADDSASPYFQYGDSHCCEVSFGFRLPRHRPCRIFHNACALERVLPPSARPANLCRAPPCCFPLLLLQPHRASLSSFSRRATCESRRRALSRSTPPASRWQPLPPRFMPALPPHARAVLLFWRAPGNSMPCRRAAVLVASDLCEPPRYFHIPSPPAAAHVITCELRRERL